MKRFRKHSYGIWGSFYAFLMICVMTSSATGADLAEIRQRGVLRHLGVPYANFVIEKESGDTFLRDVPQIFGFHNTIM